MNRTVHVSEPKWGDDPYEESRLATCATTAALGCLFFIAGLFLLFWWWLTSTVTSGRIERNQGFIEEARR